MTHRSAPTFGRAALNDQGPTEDPFLEFAFPENGNVLPADQNPLFPNPMNYPFPVDTSQLQPGQDSFPDLAFDVDTVDGALSSTYSPYLAQSGFNPGVATAAAPYLFSAGQPLSSDPNAESLRQPNPPSRPSSIGRSTRSMKLPEHSPIGSQATSAVDGSSNAPKRGRRPKPKEATADSEALNLRAKATHSEIERRYRDNLKDKILQLHHTLLAIGANPRNAQRQAPSSSPPSTAGDRVRKAEVFTNAINYIHQSELEIRHMTNEVRQLRSQLYQLEQMVGSKDLVFRNLPM